MFASQFSAYEVFSIISGICLIVVALLPGLDGSERFWSFVGGMIFVAYGIFVAQQSTGIYYFPVWIFIIPFVAVIYGIAVVVGRSSSVSPGDRSAGTPGVAAHQQQQPTNSATPEPWQGVSIPAQPGARSSHPGGGAASPAGWHPDPWGVAQRRYWDGTSWTSHVS